jgi:hypothetical protein
MRVSSLIVPALALCALAIHAPAAGAATVPDSLTRLPQWSEPAEYKVRMSVKNGTESVVIDRYVSRGRSRTDMGAQGMNFSMIEMADSSSYMLVPEQKMIMKTSMKAGPEGGKSGPPPEAHVTFLGPDSLAGHTALKYRMDYEGGSGTVWVDPATGAPRRMESKEGSIDWSDLVVGPQKDELFKLPKDFKTLDMDEMSKSMAGGGMMSAMGGGMGVSPMGMVAGKGAQMGQQAAENYGGTVGAGIGAGLGGPLGAMAGHYIGSHVAGWITGKATHALMPGMQGMQGMQGMPGMEGMQGALPAKRHK